MIKRGMMPSKEIVILFVISFWVLYGLNTSGPAKPGDPSLKKWLLPDTPPYPADNRPTPFRIALGKMLFFDPRVNGDGNMSCATCHNPLFGWSDGQPIAKGYNNQLLGRVTPTLINTAYNSVQMSDHRKKSLEDQAMGPMEANVGKITDLPRLLKWLNTNPGYRASFELAYPGQPIDAATVSMAIASFERTIISRDSSFDRWVKGQASAMTPQQVRGFNIFRGKGRCVNCHQAPNFTDDGFYNIGLASFGTSNPDLGRYTQRPLKVLKGALFS